MSKTRTAIMMQVRLASTRLPNKALRLLGGVPVIVHAMRALSLVDADRYVVLTDPDSAEALGPIVRDAGWDCFVGDPHDVLARYITALDTFPVDRFVRATGDNPVVSHEMARAALDLADMHDADYAGILGTPYGTGVEVVSTAALRHAWSADPDAYEREHVTPRLYRNPEDYTCVLVPAPEDCTMPEMRVTLDTEDDYRYLEDLFETLYSGEPIPIRSLVAYGRTHVRQSA